jgi:DNA-binding response OmpR family regulator
VIEARDGGAAIRAFESAPPALVILDLAMPVRDGYEFLAWQKDQPEERATVPVVVVSGSEARDELELLADRFGTGVLGKPCNVDELLNVVAFILARDGATTPLPGCLRSE